MIWLLACTDPPPPVPDRPLSALEERGRALYRSGDATVRARVGGGEIASTAAPCGSCHGADGRGRREGGVTAPSLRTLRRPVVRSDGTERTPYDDAALRAALSLGVAPGGRELAAVMPRYALSRSDADAIVAWLDRLVDAPEPGVTVDTLRVGTFLPSTGPTAAASDAIRATLEAWFAEINTQGGLYGRALVLVVGEAPEDPTLRAAALERFLAQEPLVALVAPLVTGAEADIAQIAEREDLPVVGPFAAAPVPGPAPVYYLLGGPETQLGGLVDLAADAGATALRVVGSGPLADTARAAASRRGVPVTEDAVHIVYADDGASLPELLSANRSATVYIPGAALDPRLPRHIADVGFTGRIIAAVPWRETDADPRAIEELATLSARHTLPLTWSTHQRSALVAARLLVEGLTQAGADLTRGRLVEALDAVQQLNTGLLPPLSYSPTRHIGAPGFVPYALAPGGELSPIGARREP